MAIDNSAIPKGRKTYLLKMAAKMAFQQGKKILNQKPEAKLTQLLTQAETLVSHVGRLKGAAMKAVQSLSIEGYDFLPPEVVEVLEKLQSQAQPIENEVLMDVLRSELSQGLYDQLKDISPNPIAAASIGQVYEATLQGEKVVIKIQYPGVAESVDSDIDTLKALMKTFITLSQKRIKIDELMEEARRVLKMETNYRNEEQSLLKYKDYFKGSDYIIPEVYSQFTTQKVLVMSKEEGMEYTQWLKTKPSVECRKEVALHLLQLYIKEFFENQFVQTDPNPANFLINKKNQVVLLDFGATVEFDKEFVQNYQKLTKAVFSKNREKILNQVYVMGFLDPRESHEVQNLFIDFLLLSVTPFEESRQPFDFSNAEYSQEVRYSALKFTRLLKYSPPPKKLLFLHRKLGGLFMLLKKLEIKVDLSGYKAAVVNLDRLSD